MKRLAFGAICLLGCTAGTVMESAPSSAPASATNEAVTRETAVSRSSAPAAEPSALPWNCQAPLAAIEEASRFLTVTATHATVSSSCVDGPGRRVRIDEILVCPQAPDGDRRRFAATYRVTTFEEGGRQMCGERCPDVEPERSRQRIELLFAPDAGRYRLEAPVKVPGLPADATPATRAHDGDCYGKSEAFVSESIALP